jgi:DNA-binding NarL/FixJ family response regulator
MISVGIVEDHPIFRSGLVQLLHDTHDVEVTAVCRSLEEFATIPDPLPHVVLLDLHLPGLEGAAGVRYVRDRGPRVLVVSASSTSQEVVDALIAGAGGYLLKTVEGPDLLQALKVIATGATYVTPTLAGCLLTASHAMPTLELTDRERDVLILLAQGERDLDIAEELGISVRTVHSYLDRIRDKIGKRRRVDLARWAQDKGLTQEPPS